MDFSAALARFLTAMDRWSEPLDVLDYLNSVVNYKYSTFVDSYRKVFGPVRSHWRALPGRTGLVRTAGKIGIPLTLVGWFSVGSDREKLNSGNPSDQFVGGSSLLATGTGTAALIALGLGGVGVAGAASAAVFLAPAAAIVGAVAAGAYLGDLAGKAIVNTSGFQTGVDRVLNSCTPSCSNWHAVGAGASGLAGAANQGWASLWE